MMGANSQRRTPKPPPCPKFLATSRARNSIMIQMAMASSQPTIGIHESSTPTRMIQNHEGGRPAIFTQSQML